MTVQYIKKLWEVRGQLWAQGLFSVAGMRIGCQGEGNTSIYTCKWEVVTLQSTNTALKMQWKLLKKRSRVNLLRTKQGRNETEWAWGQKKKKHVVCLKGIQTQAWRLSALIISRGWASSAGLWRERGCEGERQVTLALKFVISQLTNLVSPLPNISCTLSIQYGNFLLPEPSKYRNKGQLP